MDDKRTIQEQQEEIKDLLAAIPGGIFKYEAKPRGEFTFISAQLLRLLGYTEAEFRKSLIIVLTTWCIKRTGPRF